MLLLGFSACDLLVLKPSADAVPLIVISEKLFEGTEAEKAAKLVVSGRVKRLRRLLEKNPELIDSRDTLYNASLLHLAVFQHQSECALVLLEHGADPLALDHTNRTPMLMLVYSKYHHEEQLLLAMIEKATIEGQQDSNEINRVLVHAAGSLYDLSILEGLVQRGANVDYWDTTRAFFAPTPEALTNEPKQVGKALHFESALSSATRTSRYNNLRFLLSNGANVNRGVRITLGGDTINFVQDLVEEEACDRLWWTSEEKCQDFYKSELYEALEDWYVEEKGGLRRL